MAEASSSTLSEVLPKAGLVYSERSNLNEVMCKPKILPIKSASLVRLEAIESAAAAAPAPVFTVADAGADSALGFGSGASAATQDQSVDAGVNVWTSPSK